MRLHRRHMRHPAVRRGCWFRLGTVTLLQTRRMTHIEALGEYALAAGDTYSELRERCRGCAAAAYQCGSAHQFAPCSLERVLSTL